MKDLVTLNIYKEVFKLEPGKIQTYLTIQMTPLLFRFFIGLAVDLKLIRQRKYYVMLTAAAIAGAMIWLTVIDEPSMFCAVLTLSSVFQQLFDACQSSLSIEQGRKDLIFGQEDINSWKVVFMASGMATASILATYFTSIKQPLLAF